MFALSRRLFACRACLPMTVTKATYNGITSWGSQGELQGDARGGLAGSGRTKKIRHGCPRVITKNSMPSFPAASRGLSQSQGIGIRFGVASAALPGLLLDKA